MIRYNLANSQIAAPTNPFRVEQSFGSMILAARLRNYPLDSLDRISMRLTALDDRVNSTDRMAGFRLEPLGLSDGSDQSGRYGLISVPRED